jgi:hypothetical protein
MLPQPAIEVLLHHQQAIDSLHASEIKRITTASCSTTPIGDVVSSNSCSYLWLFENLTNAHTKNIHKGPVANAIAHGPEK